MQRRQITISDEYISHVYFKIEQLLTQLEHAEENVLQQICDQIICELHTSNINAIKFNSKLYYLDKKNISENEIEITLNSIQYL